MQILVTELNIDDFIKYQNRLHIIKKINKYEKYSEIIIRDIYTPYTLVTLFESNTSYFETIKPEFHIYILNKWLHGDNFEFLNVDTNKKMVISLPDYTDKLCIQMSTNDNPIYIKMFKYDNIYSVFSINNNI